MAEAPSKCVQVFNKNDKCAERDKCAQQSGQGV